MTYKTPINIDNVLDALDSLKAKDFDYFLIEIEIRNGKEILRLHPYNEDIKKEFKTTIDPQLN